MNYWEYSNPKEPIYSQGDYPPETHSDHFLGEVISSKIGKDSTFHRIKPMPISDYPCVHYNIEGLGTGIYHHANNVFCQIVFPKNSLPSIQKSM